MVGNRTKYIRFWTCFKFLFSVLLIGCLFSCSNSKNDSLRLLDEEILKRPIREKAKKRRIDSLLSYYNPSASSLENFTTLKSICEEYKSFSFDSASKYSVLLLREAKKNKVKTQVAEAATLHAYILLSAGIINQGIDSLKNVSLDSCDNSLSARYLFTLSKGYYELANFNSEKAFSIEFNELGNRYLDSAIKISSPESIEFQSYSGYKALKESKLDKARTIYEKLIVRSDLPKRQLAMEAACLGYIYEKLKDNRKSIEYFTISAISDEILLVKEYTSLIRLAYHLFEIGDLDRSNFYINLALEDANFFGSKQRKIQVLEVLPLIKAQQLGLIKEKRDNLIILLALLVLFLLGCIWLIRTTIIKNQKIKKNEERLEQYNHELERKKNELEEAQIIKEEYVGHFFQTNTRLINKLEKLFNDLEKSIASKDISEIKFQLSVIKPNHEKKKLLHDFDLAFLKIFPDFINEINKIIDLDDDFKFEVTDSLNTELRIFALMRMGIHNNETIAKALGYSVNTIYTYKTKVRNKSSLSTEDFDLAIRNISSVKK